MVWQTEGSLCILGTQIHLREWMLWVASPKAEDVIIVLNLQERNLDWL